MGLLLLKWLLLLTARAFNALGERGILMKWIKRYSKRSEHRASRQMWRSYCKFLKQTSKDNSTSLTGLQSLPDKYQSPLTKLSTLEKSTRHSNTSIIQDVRLKQRSRLSKKESRKHQKEENESNGYTDLTEN